MIRRRPEPFAGSNVVGPKGASMSRAFVKEDMDAPDVLDVVPGEG
jgi:hypothetical protein